MATIEEIRRTKLAILRDEAGGVRKLADAVGVSEAQMSQWLNGSADSKSGKPRGMRSDSVRRIEAAMKKPEGWLMKHCAPNLPSLSRSTWPSSQGDSLSVSNC